MESAQNKLKQLVSTTPQQTLSFLVVVLVLGILDLITFDLVSEAFTLPRQDNTLDLPFVLCLVLSPISPIHGFFVLLISLYYALPILSLQEKNLNSRFLPSLCLKQIGINMFALIINAIWRELFPLGQVAFASLGFGGLLPLLILLETQDPSNCELFPPILPFNVDSHNKGFWITVVFSCLGGGDVDLWVALGMGYLLRHSPKAPRYSPVPQVEVTGQVVCDEEKRLLLLQATEKRLAAALV
jgi:hypothetical protein